MTHPALPIHAARVFPVGSGVSAKGTIYGHSILRRLDGTGPHGYSVVHRGDVMLPGRYSTGDGRGYSGDFELPAPAIARMRPGDEYFAAAWAFEALTGSFDDSAGLVRYELTYDTGDGLQGQALSLEEHLPARPAEFTYAEVARALADGAWGRVQ